MPKETKNLEKSSEIRKGRAAAYTVPVLVLILLAGSILVLYKTGWIRVFLCDDAALPFLESLGPFSFIAFILLQALQVVLAPIPGDVTCLIGGYLYGVFLGVVLSSTGLLIGSGIAFAIARAFGKPLLEKVVHRKILARFDYLLHHKRLFLVFLLFLLPGIPKDYLCFILGLGQLSMAEFLMVSSVGRLLGTILLTMGGGYIRRHEYEKLVLVVAVGLTITLLGLVFRRRIEQFLSARQIRDC